MAPRSSPGEKQKQVPVAFPATLRDRLDAAALNAGHSFAEEVRRRVERTFIDDDAADPITRELVNGIMNLAAAINADLGAPWHAYQGMHEAFAFAIAQRLASYTPLANPRGEATIRDLLGSGFAQSKEAPEAVGRTIERADRRVHSYQQLQEMQRLKLAGLAKHVRKAKEGEQS